MPETAVFNRADDPVQGPRNIRGHCLMYGHRRSVSTCQTAMQAGCFVSILRGSLRAGTALGPGQAATIWADVN